MYELINYIQVWKIESNRELQFQDGSNIIYTSCLLSSAGDKILSIGPSSDATNQTGTTYSSWIYCIVKKQSCYITVANKISF